MARIVVPRAEALTTALGGSSRESLVTLAKAIAQEVEAANHPDDRHKAVRLYLEVVRQIEGIDRHARNEARIIARSEAAIEWMGRRNEERTQKAADRAAEIMAREAAKREPGPASSLIDELAAARSKRVRRGRSA